MGSKSLARGFRSKSDEPVAAVRLDHIEDAGTRCFVRAMCADLVKLQGKLPQDDPLAQLDLQALVKHPQPDCAVIRRMQEIRHRLFGNNGHATRDRPLTSTGRTLFAVSPQATRQ